MCFLWAGFKNLSRSASDKKLIMKTPMPSSPSAKVLTSRFLNLFLWLFFSAMAGTGFLLALRLPPGSRGGQGLEALGLNRHEWGDVHTWLGYGFIFLILLHLVMHWRWLWQVAVKRRPWPVLAVLGCGLGLFFLPLLLPVEKKKQGAHPEEGSVSIRNHGLR